MRLLSRTFFSLKKEKEKRTISKWRKCNSNLVSPRIYGNHKILATWLDSYRPIADVDIPNLPRLMPTQIKSYGFSMTVFKFFILFYFLYDFIPFASLSAFPVEPQLLNNLLLLILSTGYLQLSSGNLEFSTGPWRFPVWDCWATTSFWSRKERSQESLV